MAQRENGAKGISTTSAQATARPINCPQCLRLCPEGENISILVVKSLSLNPKATLAHLPPPLPPTLPTSTNKPTHSSAGSIFQEAMWTGLRAQHLSPPLFSPLEPAGLLSFLSTQRVWKHCGIFGRTTSGIKLNYPGNLQKRENRGRSATGFLWIEELRRHNTAETQTGHTVPCRCCHPT